MCSYSGSASSSQIDSAMRSSIRQRSEERRVGKECRSRWSPCQAEDGIRDLTVTGVQTCALPIFDGDLPRVTSQLGFHGVRIHVPEKIVPQPVAVRPERWVKYVLVFRERLFIADRQCDEILDPAEIGRASCRERV